MFDHYWNSIQSVVDEKDMIVEDQFQEKVKAVTAAATEEQGHAKDEDAEQNQKTQDVLKKQRMVNFNPEINYIKKK